MAIEQQDALLAGLLVTPVTAPGLSAREGALLAYADVLTLDPANVSLTHINAMRAAGCDDRAIHDSCAVVGYFAFVNRLADGLGVELETDPPAIRPDGR